MAGAKNHDYHILPPSIWPIFGAFSALVLAMGGVMWMNTDFFGASGSWVFGIGVLLMAITFYSWWADVVS
ncbi:MAG: cytochrome c oxidase subunit 3, partial [Parasphingorhabdus sp.]